jgi:hypothetical protein
VVIVLLADVLTEAGSLGTATPAVVGGTGAAFVYIRNRNRNRSY